jgi:hypothetical protein
MQRRDNQEYPGRTCTRTYLNFTQDVAENHFQSHYVTVAVNHFQSHYVTVAGNP